MGSNWAAMDLDTLGNNMADIIRKPAEDVVAAAWQHIDSRDKKKRQTPERKVRLLESTSSSSDEASAHLEEDKDSMDEENGSKKGSGVEIN